MKLVLSYCPKTGIEIQICRQAPRTLGLAAVVVHIHAAGSGAVGKLDHQIGGAALRRCRRQGGAGRGAGQVVQEQQVTLQRGGSERASLFDLVGVGVHQGSPPAHFTLHPHLRDIAFDDGDAHHAPLDGLGRNDGLGQNVAIVAVFRGHGIRDAIDVRQRHLAIEQRFVQTAQDRCGIYGGAFDGDAVEREAYLGGIARLGQQG
ncbi:MAG: hypothetical protein MZW92_21925 [Comamonadaceae bacterium]|nr:hypothetical protein [Comamonadaceae bacterium]